MASLLVVCAHPDDEVLGCGGYIAKRSRLGDEVTVAFVADGVGSRVGSSFVIELEARRAAARKAGEILGVSRMLFSDFPDNQLDTVPLLKVIQYVEDLVEKYKPSLVMTHHWGDLNVDHRIVNQATVTAVRPLPGGIVKELLFCEVPSSTEWQVSGTSQTFIPNWYEDISEVLPVKLDALRAYEMETRSWPHPRSLLSVEYLARWRGSACGVGAAEGFVLGRRVP